MRVPWSDGLLTLLTTGLTQRWQRAEHREERAEQKREAKAALQREACARYLSATEGVVMAVSTSPRSRMPDNAAVTESAHYASRTRS